MNQATTIEYLSPQEYAERFNYEYRTVLRWCQKRTIQTLPRPRGTREYRIVVTPADRGEVAASNVVPFRRPITKEAA